MAGALALVGGVANLVTDGRPAWAVVLLALGAFNVTVGLVVSRRWVTPAHGGRGDG
ncbi:hypothetical protein [Cellulomonas sp. JZ18]|uniref:hypothetical protein n=1 Tax=Cellulomonas sp. JZ18 TaxID=2654191 RepID=UPI0012D3DB88|nr:hypothetical protein [Cellulomonas sp. JZ18]